MAETSSDLRNGALLMTIAGVGFIVYGIVFLLLNFFGGGFELGVDTIEGISRQDLTDFSPAVLDYISHLHVATAGFITATGIAVTGLSWYGVRNGRLWAWTTAVIAAVTGLVIAIPLHFFDLFSYNWVLHLGPIYVATIIFVIGAGIGLRGIRASA